MPHRVIVKIAIGIMAFAQTWICANAATLPPPGKLCKLIAATADEGNTDSAPKWKWSKTGYWCDTTGMLEPDVGAVYMVEYQASGPAKKTATTLYFKFEIHDIPMVKAAVAAPVLSRLSAVFAASNAGPVPDDLVQAVTNVTNATVQTALGTAQTRYTPSDRPNEPDNGATFEVQINAK